MVLSFICVSSGRFRPCYLQELYHIPPVLCGFRRFSQTPAAAVRPAVPPLWPQSPRPTIRPFPGQIPTLATFPRHYPLPLQKFDRMLQETPALPPHPPGRIHRYPSLYSLPARNRTPPPAPPRYSNRPPTRHQNRLALSPPVPSSRPEPAGNFPCLSRSAKFRIRSTELVACCNPSNVKFSCRRYGTLASAYRSAEGL